jgi:hypothetical protein
MKIRALTTGTVQGLPRAAQSAITQKPLTRDPVLTVLDPDVVRRADTGATDPGVPRILRGARAVAKGAIAFAPLGSDTRRATVNGAPGVVTFADGEPYSVLGFTVARGKIVEMNILIDPDRIRRSIPEPPPADAPSLRASAFRAILGLKR